jgi:DNA-directed RNA polymerase subunit beta
VQWQGRQGRHRPSGNRRIRSVGELLENKMRLGLTRMERAVRERMSIVDMEQSPMPSQLISTKPITAGRQGVLRHVAALSIHGSDQSLGRTHAQSAVSRPSARAVLNRERAGFEVPTSITTHYGRLCPIENAGKDRTSVSSPPWRPMGG